MKVPLRIRSSPHGDHKAAPDDNPLHDASWLYSYADLMTQLLIFSVLIVTVGGLAVARRAPAAKPSKDGLAETVRELDALVARSDLGGAMVVERGGDRIVIRMKSRLLFDEGQADLTPRAETVLAEVVPLLARMPNAVRVEGHTDDVPIHSDAFPSNWELSTARAISVETYLEQRGISRSRLSVAGYGEFHPMITAGRDARAVNRRVEIVVLGE